MEEHEVSAEDKPVQTRNDAGGLGFFRTMKEAMAYAESHRDVWKVSVTCASGERIRLVREEGRPHRWCYEPIVL